MRLTWTKCLDLESPWRATISIRRACSRRTGCRSAAWGEKPASIRRTAAAGSMLGQPRVGDLHGRAPLGRTLR